MFLQGVRPRLLFGKMHTNPRLIDVLMFHSRQTCKAAVYKFDMSGRKGGAFKNRRFYKEMVFRLSVWKKKCGNRVDINRGTVV